MLTLSRVYWVISVPLTVVVLIMLFTNLRSRVAEIAENVKPVLLKYSRWNRFFRHEDKDRTTLPLHEMSSKMKKVRYCYELNQ